MHTVGVSAAESLETNFAFLLAEQLQSFVAFIAVKFQRPGITLPGHLTFILVTAGHQTSDFFDSLSGYQRGQ